MKKNLFIIAISVTILMSIAYSQSGENLPLSADSLATGNYKDVLNSFFQLGLNNIIGPNKSLSFVSNPYAVMAKLDTGLLIDREYYKYRYLRRLNFSFSTQLDSSYKFNGFSSGLKYALIDQRDETVSNAFRSASLENNKVKEAFVINQELTAYITTLFSTPELQTKLTEQKTKFTRGEINFKELDQKIQDKVKEIIRYKKLEYISGVLQADPDFNFKKTINDIYKDIKEYYNNKLLWTVGVADTTYKDQFMFSNVVVSTELLKGIDSLKNSDIEINLRSTLHFTDDSLKVDRDLKRCVFNIEPGVNFVLKNRQTLKSFLEFKLSGSYSHTFSSLYENEKRDLLTLNGTLRIRILNDIWVPLEIKYEPKTGNIFGFLNIRANFTALGSGKKN
jgi:hypothetical protein